MKMYYFFEIDSKGDRSYGEEFFVMSTDLESAKNAVVNCAEYKEREYCDISTMGHSEHGLNEVVQTELS